MTSQFGGLGLGLAISKRVIDLHKGTISAASAGPGEGATFTIRLDAMETSLLDQSPILSLDTAPAGRAAILLVEDHENTARILESAGYSVAHANSLARARELAAEREFEPMISDLGLPDGSGLELMRFLRGQRGPSGIDLSGFGTDEDVAASRAAGFAEHLTKPVDWPQLRAAIDRLLSVKSEARAPAAASPSRQ